MATPLTVGQTCAFDLSLWNFFPAFMRGLSSLPPPATTPIVALHLGSRVFSVPEGICTTDLFTSCVIRSAYVPDDLAIFPPSPGLSSMLYIGVPSGISAMGSVLPCFMGAEIPQAISSPTLSPSETSISLSSPFVNLTCATGALLPGSCSMSTTVPVISPVFSWSSYALCVTFPLYRCEGALYFDVPLPLLCTISLFPILFCTFRIFRFL